MNFSLCGEVSLNCSSIKINKCKDSESKLDWNVYLDLIENIYSRTLADICIFVHLVEKCIFPTTKLTMEAIKRVDLGSIVKFIKNTKIIAYFDDNKQTGIIEYSSKGGKETRRICYSSCIIAACYLHYTGKFVLDLLNVPIGDVIGNTNNSSTSPGIYNLTRAVFYYIYSIDNLKFLLSETGIRKIKKLSESYESMKIQRIYNPILEAIIHANGKILKPELTYLNLSPDNSPVSSVVHDPNGKKPMFSNLNKSDTSESDGPVTSTVSKNLSEYISIYETDSPPKSSKLERFSKIKKDITTSCPFGKTNTELGLLLYEMDYVKGRDKELISPEIVKRYISIISMNYDWHIKNTFDTLLMMSKINAFGTFNRNSFEMNHRTSSNASDSSNDSTLSNVSVEEKIENTWSTEQYSYLLSSGLLKEIISELKDVSRNSISPITLLKLSPKIIYSIVRISFKFNLQNRAAYTGYFTKSNSKTKFVIDLLKCFDNYDFLKCKEKGDIMSNKIRMTLDSKISEYSKFYEFLKKIKDLPEGKINEEQTNIIKSVYNFNDISTENKRLLYNAYKDYDSSSGTSTES